MNLEGCSNFDLTNG